MIIDILAAKQTYTQERKILRLAYMTSRKIKNTNVGMIYAYV